MSFPLAAIEKFAAIYMLIYAALIPTLLSRRRQDFFFSQRPRDLLALNRDISPLGLGVESISRGKLQITQI